MKYLPPMIQYEYRGDEYLRHVLRDNGWLKQALETLRTENVRLTTQVAEMTPAYEFVQAMVHWKHTPKHGGCGDC